MKRSIVLQGRGELEDDPVAVTSAGSCDLSTVSSDQQQLSNFASPNISFKKKRSLPGNPDPEADVVALSPKSLLATNRFMCEICNKGFQRDQNLQLHKRGHNLPWKLKQRSSNEIKKKKVYICPVLSCVHHDRTRALGDLTGIKKHFSRKHGEKKWKCEKCSKKYAVQSDWKAHSKTCGTKEYRCDCGTLFSRRDSFITHRAFCDALAEESARVISTNSMEINHLHHHNHHSQFNGFQDLLPLKMRQDLPPWLIQTCQGTATSNLPFHNNSPFSSRLEHDTSEGYTTTNNNNSSSQSSLPALPPALLHKTGTTTQTTTGHSPSHQAISGLFGRGGGLISSSSSTQESTGGNGYVHDMMLPSLPTSSTEPDASGLYVSYEDAAAINIHEERKRDHGLTRDLLGLRAFSHNDIMNMVGLDPIPNTSTSSSSYNHHHPQHPWLG